MLLPTTNLDDRRWPDLVEEGRNLIPRFAPEWTDHNVHDPGITLIELLAYLAEMQIFRVDRIPPAHRQKFLQLLGIKQRPPRPARALLQGQLKPDTAVLMLPKGVEFEAISPHHASTRFRTVTEVALALLALKRIYRQRSDDWTDLTGIWQDGHAIFPFGETPSVGDTFYLGFSQPLPKDQQCGLYFEFAGECAGTLARQQLYEENLRQQGQCLPIENPCQENSLVEEQERSRSDFTWLHHSVRLEWEAAVQRNGQIVWYRLAPNASQIIDDTRAFSLNGMVMLKIPYDMAAVDVGGDGTSFYYLRCCLLTGEYDAPPQIQQLFCNAFQVEQVTPCGQELIIAKDAVIEGQPPAPGTTAALQLEFNEAHEIRRVKFIDAANNEPRFFFRGFVPPAPGKTGVLDIELNLLGLGNGLPNQQFRLTEAPVYVDELQVFSLESGRWRRWSLVDDFEASHREQAHFILEATTGVICCGEGEHGRVLPKGIPLLAVCTATRAQAGNVVAGGQFFLANSAHNQALLGNVKGYQVKLALVTNQSGASGGEAEETLEHATGRAFEATWGTTRAVTIDDLAALARQTPGTCIARAMVKANFDYRYPGLKAPGVISLTVVPNQRTVAPTPSPGLRRAVQRFLRHRRVVGTCIHIIGPQYTRVTVRATVQLHHGNDAERVKRDIIEKLRVFLHPLHGGPNGDGWPLGRDVYRSEILQAIDEVAGVNFVNSLELIADAGEPQCGNLCIGPCGLVYSGSHIIEVVDHVR